ncbi:MAG: hypothetical protein IJW54_06285 [Clostridia bacterium]|nr:hypothetical protein [Clostridia bacterium]
MAKGKAHSQEVYEKAIAMLNEGNKVPYISKELGVPEGTLYMWKNDADKDPKYKEVRDKITKERITKHVNKAWDSLELAMNILERKLKNSLVAEKKREQLIKKLLDGKGDKSFEQLKSELSCIIPDSLGEIVRSFGVLSDKIAVMRGTPTQNLAIDTEKKLKFEDL